MVIRCKVLNTSSEFVLLPDIKCVTITVNCDYDEEIISYSKFIHYDRNVKFDDTLHKFGEINEIIYSKTNINNTNILKFGDVKYPMVDQFGYSIGKNRFIFKSDWDSDFHYNTLDSFINDSSIYGNPSPKSMRYIDDNPSSIL